jgi:hypothetical protein
MPICGGSPAVKMAICWCSVTSSQRASRVKKALLVFVDGPGASQVRELAQGVAPRRRPEALVDSINEISPGWLAVVLLQAVVPLADGALQIERGRPYLLCRRRALIPEELLELVETAQQIFRAVVFGESEFVNGRRRRPERIPAG